MKFVTTRPTNRPNSSTSRRAVSPSSVNPNSPEEGIGGA